MSDITHRIHGVAGDHVAPDWPPITRSEVDDLLRGYAVSGAIHGIEWHSPRPLSAACLVRTETATLFVKRHHRRVRTVATLSEEHRFIAHQRAMGIPVPRVMCDRNGNSVAAMGAWVYEVHEAATGIDLYRDVFSWSPLANVGHAFTAGRMLATMHDAATDYVAPQRNTHILVARCDLIAAPDPIAALQAQLPDRPGLAAYLNERDWIADLRRALAPWHGHAQPRISREPRLWTHGDWHVSNLFWSGDRDDASVAAVLDFGLAAETFALFDLATAIERNAIAWLQLEQPDAPRVDIALALIEGYRQQRRLDADDIHLLADILPIVHVDFALSEVEYFHGITASSSDADVAYTAFLLGHIAWFDTPPGQALLQAIRALAG
ncbi:Ser/Thr protein kinase RdoA (MazF antagonist) [Luteibacter rhizovicinus]|uniref:Ser/Thr protein kinase RdoA (MazF antagonist) n=1 Tax=Luteibacter rhizovicinus TaxID=242606 RepID=A0A4V2W3U8_9GAMM|nr:phosphotransferase [Luteibacter rhizovicinus]TCV93389.1 Ser/Thr protein kinase RdoA (MazF antagonist) [Luteibacter rhizovicinus]